MARPDLELLLNSIIPAAQYLLNKNGELYPIGAVLDMNGKVAFAAPHIESENPPSQQVIDLLLQGFREQAAKNEIKAIAICYDSRVLRPGQTEKVDALCGEFEHADGESITVYYPYKKGWLKRYKYEASFASTGENRVFRRAGTV